jgi:hypothetical protein
VVEKITSERTSRSSSWRVTRPVARPCTSRGPCARSDPARDGHWCGRRSSDRR